MDSSRISALLQPFLDRPLSPVQLDEISTYIDLLLRWNARINLTAIRDPESIVTRHFGESLFLARHALPVVKKRLTDSDPNVVAGVAITHHAPPVERTDSRAPHLSAGHVRAETKESALADDTNHLSEHDRLSGSNAIAHFNAPTAERRKIPAHSASRGSLSEKENPAPLGAKEKNAAETHVLDIGSGAGFPGLPLKIWAPHISLTLIESNHKKVSFLREVSRALTLADIDVIAERAEALVDRFPVADLVTFRAVEHFENILPLAVRFLAPSGRLAVLAGYSQFPTLTRLAPRLSWASAIPVPCSDSRVLAIAGPGT